MVGRSQMAGAVGWIDGIGNLVAAFTPYFVGLLIGATGGFTAGFLFAGGLGRRGVRLRDRPGGAGVLRG